MQEQVSERLKHYSYVKGAQVNIKEYDVDHGACNSDYDVQDITCYKDYDVQNITCLEGCRV